MFRSINARWNGSQLTGGGVFLVSQLRFSAMHGTAKYSCKYLIEYLLLNYLLSAGFVYGKPI